MTSSIAPSALAAFNRGPASIDIGAALPAPPTGAPIYSAPWWLAVLEPRLLARQSTMQLFDDYYRGSHRLTLHTSRILEAFGATFRDLRINFCGVVVDALVERLAVEGFRFGGPKSTADQDAAAEAAWMIWQNNNLDALFPRGLRSGLIKGESSLLVWVDGTGEPRITVESAAEVIVATNPGNPRHRRAALKRWWDQDAGRLFATVYLPGGIYKYQSALTERLAWANQYGRSFTTSAAWEQRAVEGEPWPIPNPLGEVPVFAIPNKPDDYGVGTSELAQIVPIQDAINANVVNVMLAGQFSAFRQKTATNVTLEPDPDDPTKLKMPWRIAQDSIVTAPPPVPGQPETKFGEWGESDLAGYIGLHEAFVQAVSTISRTPPHYFLGQQGVFPSGEALRAVEAGLTEKARDRIRDDSDPVEDAMRFAFRLKARKPSESGASSRRFERWAERSDTETLWRDPETRSESEHVDAITKLSGIGVPEEALWEMIPASPVDITRWKAMKAAEPPPPAPVIIDPNAPPTGTPPAGGPIITPPPSR